MDFELAALSRKDKFMTLFISTEFEMTTAQNLIENFLGGKEILPKTKYRNAFNQTCCSLLYHVSSEKNQTNLKKSLHRTDKKHSIA